MEALVEKGQQQQRRRNLWQKGKKNESISGRVMSIETLNMSLLFEAV